MTHEILPVVLLLKESDAFEGPAMTPVLLNQSRASSMRPWKSQAIRIRKALPCQHMASISQVSSHSPHEAPGRTRRQRFHLVLQHYPISKPSAAAARREHSTIALVALAYHPDSFYPI